MLKRSILLLTVGVVLVGNTVAQREAPLTKKKPSVAADRKGTGSTTEPKQSAMTKEFRKSARLTIDAYRDALETNGTNLTSENFQKAETLFGQLEIDVETEGDKLAMQDVKGLKAQSILLVVDAIGLSVQRQNAELSSSASSDSEVSASEKKLELNEKAALECGDAIYRALSSDTYSPVAECEKARKMGKSLR